MLSDLSAVIHKEHLNRGLVESCASYSITVRVLQAKLSVTLNHHIFSCLEDCPNYFSSRWFRVKESLPWSVTSCQPCAVVRDYYCQREYTSTAYRNCYGSLNPDIFARGSFSGVRLYLQWYLIQIVVKLYSFNSSLPL